MKRKRVLSRLFFVVVLCSLILFLYRGTSPKRENGINFVQNSKMDIYESKTGEKELAKYMEDEVIKQVCESVERIDFSVQEYPISIDVYDTNMDKEYKSAFLQALYSQSTIQDKEEGEYYFRKVRPELNASDGKEYANILKNWFYYYYFDFDGDGLPELIVRSMIDNDPHFGGPRILKYCPEDKQVYNFRSGDWARWRPLSSGKMYYDDPTSAGMRKYGYREINSLGEVSVEVLFDQGVDNLPIYLISVEEFEDIEVGEEIWNELTRDFFEAEANAISYMTYEELFGDVTLP